jgi:Resolvase, N terminal domain
MSTGTKKLSAKGLGCLSSMSSVTATSITILPKSRAGERHRFRSLSDAWADITTAHGRLMLTILGGLAEFERELIRARTGEGRKLAKARGVEMGRKPKLTGGKPAAARGRRTDPRDCPDLQREP